VGARRHDGRELWRYFWKTRGGTHIGNRGAALWHNYLYVETPDNYLVSLDARTGKERWHVEIASFNEQYFSTPAPVVIDNHVIVGTGNDLDMPGFLQSFDPETGKLQWKTYTVPMNPGDPGLETWPSLEAARHGGAQTWIPGAYDPDTRLYIIGTGNPTPGYTGQGRKGDNLYACSLVAFNVDTGKMAWYYQTSPHDTHDWDSAQTPILIDGTINGRRASWSRRRRATATSSPSIASPASRRHVDVRHDDELGEGMRKNGCSPIRIRRRKRRARLARVAGRRRRDQLAAAGVLARHGLFYVHERNGFNILYLTETDPRGSMGWRARRSGRSALAERAARDRLPHREGGLASRVPRRERRGRLGRGARHGRQAGVHRRRRRQLRGVRRDQRHAAVALADRLAVERTRDLLGAGAAARAGGGRRPALRLRALLIRRTL
jgi:alcohol dehydrogenase (cytochrome c)